MTSGNLSPFLRSETIRSSQKVHQAESGPMRKKSLRFENLNAPCPVQSQRRGGHHDSIRSAVSSALPFQSGDSIG